MYDLGFGNIYHPKIDALTCRDIPRDLEYNNQKWIHHQHQGRRIKKQKGRLLLFRGVEINGRRIKNPDECLEQRKTIPPSSLQVPDDTSIHEECLPQFPGWKGQLESLTDKLKSTEEAEKVEKALEEIEVLWKDWIRSSAKSYLQGKDYSITYNRPPSKHKVAQNIDKISDQLRLNTKIITTFFKNYRERCLIDCSFLLSENGRTVAELEKQLKDFVKHTKRILSFEWPMSVANLMLDEGASWIPLFVTSASQAVFNSVAATMSRLLYDVIVENITRVKTFFDVDDRARLIIQLREEDEEFDYWQKIKVLLELCKIPRVDHKIYPRVFTEAWIDVTNWFNSEKIAFKTLPNPFETTKSRIAKMQEMLITAKENPDDIKFWELLAQEILSLRDETLRQCTRTFEGFIIYDISEMKRNYLAKIAELEEKTKSVVLTHLSAINSEIRLSFSRCSSKLFRNDVLTQLRNIEEVQNEMPSIKEKIRLVGSAYKVYMEYFIMPDYDIRQFYEISRLGMKLEQLVNFVWDRINHERQWITKQVSEQTTKNYYECEMIEKEWLDCLKKYRSSQRINEVQKIQIKMSNLEEKSRILKEKDEKLIGQRSLLGLPASPIDCTRISKICEFFANLSLCHFQILLHHESCLRMRISEVDHNFLVAETERLQAEKDKLAEQAIAINEHVTTSKEALSKMQSVLAEFEKLLPVLGAISCQAMKDRHWQQILQGSESTVKVEGNPLVSELLEMNFIEQADKFEEVGAQAEKERILETSIEKMRNQWKSATFITHHGGELLTTELNVQMQAHLARSQTIITSPHALSILDHIRHWLDTLLSLNTFVQLYKQCDVRWRKIEGVFSTEDIAYQMPQEFRTFKKISLKWVNINNRISEERPILEQMELVEQLNMELSELEVLFGRMENGFHAYLRKKRAVFPRLFCLSDELVLSLICDSREPANCKSYLPLLFPALTSFEQNTKMEIVSVSTVSETIPLVKPVNVNSSKRHVEKWMHELDAQIKYTLKTKIRRLIEKMNYKLSPVESVLGEPVQVAVVYLKIAFAFQMENSMKQNSLTILASELKICLKECQSIIIHKRCQKEFLGPLFHVYKAASRLTNKFINEQVIFLDDPRWTSHLRYYWHMENVFIRVCTVSARYDYEIQSAEFVLDQESVDQVLKNFIFMNHFGFNIITPRVNAQLARQVAGALGKPFAICDSEMESDCKMLIEGSLLLGGIVYMLRKGSEDGNDDIGVFVERDVYSSRIISNLKYTFETEISISTSFMLLLKSAFRTAKVVTLDEESYKKTIDENFSMHSISHREKKIQKFQIFTEFENYLGARNLWKNYLQTTIANIIENEALEQEQSIENVLYHVFGAALARKNKKLMKKLLLIAPTKSKKTMTPSSKNLDPDYLTQKAEVLCNLLQKHKVVVVCGASQTGKSRMISMAARMKAAELQVEFGMWEDISNGGGETQKHKKHDKWIVIDGLMDPKTKQWINRLKSEFAIFSWRNLPIIAPGERVIVETDTIPQADEDLRQLPMVVLENQEDTARETNLDNNEQQRIDEIIDWSPELKSRKLEITRKIEELKKSLTFNSEKLTNYLTATSILSIAPLQKLRSIPNWKSESELTDFFQNIPFSNGWNKRKDTSDIPPAHFYIIHTISLILCSNYIPVLVCPPSKEFNEFLAVLQAELDKLDWHMITMSIDRNVTISEIKEFVDNCAIMFGGRHHISEEEEEESEGFNYFLIKGIEDAAPDVVDWLRHKFERKQIMKMLFITPNFIETFHSRFSRFLFQINWMDINRQTNLTNFPLSNYQFVLENLTKDTKSKELNDSICNHLLDAMLDASALNLYETVSNLKTANEYNLVRAKVFIKEAELCSLYNRELHEIASRDRRIRRDAVQLSNKDSKNINAIEKVLKVDYGHIIVVGNDEAKCLDALTISTELNGQHLFTNYGIKNVQQWREQMGRILRECLIDGADIVLGLEINQSQTSENINNAILEDITCICCYKTIPLRYLTRLLLSEFGEKHTLEGNRIWAVLETKLSAFKVALILKPSDFSWFVNSHKRLLVKLILIWWGDPSKQEQEQELYNELNNSHLFTEVQTSQIMRIVDDLVDAKLISIRVEKLRILKTIVKLAGKQKEEVKRTMVKYEKGMEKMKKAEEQVAGMQGELLRLQPQLVRTSIETSMLMSTIEKETIEVENAREVVAANEYKANEAATKAQALKAESEAELASAIPALESAVEALETMTQSDVSSLKTMRFPPYAVRLCMEAVCILLGVKPAKSTNEIGEVVNDYWVSGQKLLSDIHFLAKIRAFERDSMSKKTMKLIRDKYLSKEEFSPENVKQCSLAAEGLCRWVLAIDMYNQISKVVEPKRERLRKAEMLVKQHLKQLEVKRKALLKVTDKLQGLSDQFSQMCQKKQELESQIVSCEVRMERAERLVQALSGEKDQWKNKIAEIMREDSFNVPYSVGFTLALHVFGKLPLDERQKNLRKTMISLFPKIEVTIPCDLKSLVMLIEDSICFVNDDGRALEFLTTQFEKVIVTSQWTETERQMCLTPKSVLLFEISAENEDVAKDIEQADYFNFGEEDLIIMKIRSTQYEVNRHFRVFFRTPQRGTVLKRSIIIDNTFSDMDLKKGICEKMGLSNWGQTLNHYNAMVASRTENVRKVEKTENEMLELLGRSKDLDDERAIELLAEARNLQALVAAQSKDISEIEQSLRAVEHKMSPVIEYSLKVVKLCASLYLLDRFYKVSIMPLVDILETKLVENISSINFEQVSLAISELYWEFLHHSLSWEHKLIVNHLLFNNLNAKVEKLETTTQNQRIFDGFHNFSTFILNCKPRQLILLKYDAEVYATILQFGQVTKNANWRVFSIMEHVIALLRAISSPKLFRRLEKLADEPIWLLLNVNRSDQKTLSQMKTILEKLKLLPVVHLSFRIILAYSDEVDCSDELIALTPTRFYFSASASLVQQTRRILANLSIRPFLDKSQETQKVQIIRMLAFHYGLTLRRKFDPEFDVLVDDADLFAMLKLYQELKNLSDEPNEQEEMLKVKLNVIEPIYYSKTKNAVELGVISGMVQWIVEGNLSIPADTLLRAVIKEKQTNYEDFAHFMQSHDDSILCGSNSRISRQCRAAQKQESIRNMKRLMELPNDTPLPSAILGKITSEPKNTVIDVESVEREVDGREMQNLTKIVAALKMKFCLKYKIGIADVEITGEVVDDNYNVNKKEFEEIPILKITNCCLISAQLSQGELKEPHNRQYDHICVLLKPMKLSTLNPRSLLLICPTSQKSVAAIPVHSQFPIAHWQLRGAFVTTGRIIQQKF